MDPLKTDLVNKNVLLVITLFSLALAAWMMASRYETLHQMQTLQAAQDGAQLRIKELTDKLTEKDLEVEKVAKLSAEEAVKKIINIPELDKVLGIKSSSSGSESSSSSANASSDQSPSYSSTQPSSSTSEARPENEQPQSITTDVVGKTEDVTGSPSLSSDQTSSISSPPPDTSSTEAVTSSGTEPSVASPQPVPSETNPEAAVTSGGNAP